MVIVIYLFILYFFTPDIIKVTKITFIHFNQVKIQMKKESLSFDKYKMMGINLILTWTSVHM